MHPESQKLAAGRLASDPRIAQAKELLREALNEHQHELTSIKAPIAALEKPYQQLIATFGEQRGAPLWYPYLGSGIGNGAFVELLDGSVKLDFITGIGSHYFGHSYPPLMEAEVDAALSDVVMEGNLQQNGDAAALADLLLDYSGMDHLFLTTSGAMANENALKIALQKKNPASRILAFERCFAGRSLILSQITDKPSFRQGLPLSFPVDYIPFFDAKRPEESTREAVAVLKKHVTRYPKQHAAMIFELIQGEAGFFYGSKEFFHALMSILKEQEILIIDDEIQSFGRLPEMFAFHFFELEPFVDIVTIGKLAQVCATLFRSEVCPNKGLLSQTFTGSTSAIRAALLLLRELHQGDYYGKKGRILQLHDRFISHLKRIESRFPGSISGPYGLGAMIALTPFDGSSEKTIAFNYALYEAGLMSFIAGANPTRVRFLPPFGVVTDREIDLAAEIIEKTLETF